MAHQCTDGGCSHGSDGVHASEVGSRLSNWGGTSAPLSQWADLPMADVAYLLTALAAIVFVWWSLGRIGDALQSFVDGRAVGHRHRLALIAVATWKTGFRDSPSGSPDRAVKMR